MSKVNVDHTVALSILEQAVRDASSPAFKPSSKYREIIAEIVNGEHLTYKYVLATALLAKATEPKVNPLALQSGAGVEGAYDARSLCHQVIVPHEAKLLENGLGGSNEPFLNKPARNKLISLDNPVRQGKDKRTLNALHEVLTALKSQEQSRLGLQDLIFFAKKHKRNQTAILTTAVFKAVGGRVEIIAFLLKLISSSVHGETSVLATAIIFWIIGVSRGQKWQIEIHPVNESGSSSNEIGDIDVYYEGKLLFTAEVKDKKFKEHDVEHAVEKVSASNESLQEMAENKKVELIMISLESLIVDLVSFAPADLNLKQVAEQARQFAAQARVKAGTLKQLTDSLS
jgi:hypothetical protein